MATPVVAGSAALVRQYFMGGFYPDGRPSTTNRFTPSGALVKAVLIGGAAHMQASERGPGGGRGGDARIMWLCMCMCSCCGCRRAGW